MSDSSEVSIRIAGPQDAEAIHQMVVALARDTGAETKVGSTPANILRYGFGRDALFEVLIAEKERRPVGLCLYFFSFSSWLGEPGIYVQDLYVSPNERRSGLGRRLLRETARHGRRRDASHLRLSVDHQNIEASRFYERIGMHHRSEEDTFHIGSTEFLDLAAGSSG